MSLASFDAYLTNLQKMTWGADQEPTLTTVAGQLFSLWRSGTANIDQGAAPTTAAVPSLTTIGAIQFSSGSSVALAQMEAWFPTGGSLIVIDRLSHQGGLSGTTTTAQTTNLPTAALTRYTTGDGVFAAVEVYTAIGATAIEASVSYTNQAGTAGRTGAVRMGGTGYNTAQRFLPMQFQAGDTGCRSVESITLGTSTGTAGNFGITLYKPVFLMPCPLVSGQATIFLDTMLGGGGAFQGLFNSACLQLLVTCVATTTGQMLCKLGFIENS